MGRLVGDVRGSELFTWAQHHLVDRFGRQLGVATRLAVLLGRPRGLGHFAGVVW